MGDEVCDDFCNLCACSTAREVAREEQAEDGLIAYHCSNHGECIANCTSDICHSARCECKDGWTGDKCDVPRNMTIFFSLTTILD